PASDIHPPSLHDALPICRLCGVAATPPWPGATDGLGASIGGSATWGSRGPNDEFGCGGRTLPVEPVEPVEPAPVEVPPAEPPPPDRKSTRLNSSHVKISY